MVLADAVCRTSKQPQFCQILFQFVPKIYGLNSDDEDVLVLRIHKSNHMVKQTGMRFKTSPDLFGLKCWTHKFN